MAVAKTIEITSTSKKGFDDAIKAGVAKAAESLANITGAWVMDQSVDVRKGKVTEYRVRMKLTFVLK
jgi:flavin-binding protein dodecin